MKKMFLLLGLLLFSLSASAFTKTYTESYIMSDNESKESAKSIVLSKIRNKAANKVGYYVQSKKEFDHNGKIKETGEAISAAIVELVVINESYLITKDGRINMKLKVRASVDDSVLLKRIKAVMKDKGKDEKIKELGKINQQLLSQLNRIEAAIKEKGLNEKDSLKILKEKEELFVLIEGNKNKIKNILQGKSLLDLVNQKENEAEKAYIEGLKTYKKLIAETNSGLNAKAVTAEKKNSFVIVNYEMSIKDFIKKIQVKWGCPNYNYRSCVSTASEGELNLIKTWVDVLKDHPLYLISEIEGRKTEHFLLGVGRDGDRYDRIPMEKKLEIRLGHIRNKIVYITFRPHENFYEEDYDRISLDYEGNIIYKVILKEKDAEFVSDIKFYLKTK